MKRNSLKLFSALLALVILVGAIPLVVQAEASTGTTGDCTWTLDGTVLTISGNGAMEDFFAPWGRTGITQIIIEQGVTGIGNDAFSHCTGLTSVTIPNSVTRIGNYAFSWCTSLTSVTILGSVISIGEEAFSWCISLSSVSILDGVTSIGDGAFANCSLTEITIPDSVTSIGDGAFANCSLTKITIPNSVTSIGDSAFSGCYNLIIYGATGSYAEEYANKNTIPFVAISGITGDCTWTLNGTALTISGNGAMEDYDSSAAPWDAVITQVIIEQGVTGIGDSAFEDCKNLTMVTIPDSVTSIGGRAFSKCWNLNSVTIPSSVTSIENYAFYICKSLTMVNIPSSVTRIGDYAFFYCTSLTSITIPDSVTTIGDDAFGRCDSLTNIMVDVNNTVYASEDGVLFNKEKTQLICYPAGKSGAYTIPSSVTSIGDAAFLGCTSLTTVTIPDSVTSIENSVFSGCTSLTTVTIPSSVTSIGHSAFFDCSSLTTVTIPDSVTSIGYSAFRGCRSLTTVTIPDSVTGIGNGAFEGCDNLTIHGVAGSYAEEYANDHDIPFVAIDDSTDDPTDDPADNPITSSQYTIADNQISQITEGTTVEKLLAGIDQGATCEVVRDGVLLSKDTPLGTGMVVQIMDGDTVKDFCTIVVEGDNDGDSTINAKDALLALQHAVKLTVLQNAYASAADVDGNGQIDASDALLVLQYTVKLINSFPTNQPKGK